MSTENIVAAAGSAFYVVDTGEKDLVPVVCLHSLFLDNRQFEGFTEAARGRYRVVRPDFRGQGQSAAADRDVITMERNAGEMAAVVDALGITRAHFVVSSMGGDVGARLAAYRPDLVRTMVFTGSSARNRLGSRRSSSSGLRTSATAASWMTSWTTPWRSCSVRRPATTRSARTSSTSGRSASQHSPLSSSPPWQA